MQMAAAVWLPVIMAQRPLAAVAPSATKAVFRMVEVAMEAVLAVMGATAVTAEPVVGPVVGDGLVGLGMEHLIAGCGGAEMAMQVGRAMGDPIIGMASMVMLSTHRCCVIQIRTVRHEVPDLGVNTERVI